jgi:hypothetical protein
MPYFLEAPANMVHTSHIRVLLVKCDEIGHLLFLPATLSFRPDHSRYSLSHGAAPTLAVITMLGTMMSVVCTVLLSVEH